jgi:hypothetical protein
MNPFGMIFLIFRTGSAYRDSLHRTLGGPARWPVSIPVSNPGVRHGRFAEGKRGGFVS